MLGPSPSLLLLAEKAEPFVFYEMNKTRKRKKIVKNEENEQHKCHFELRKEEDRMKINKKLHLIAKALGVAIGTRGPCEFCFPAEKYNLS